MFDAVVILFAAVVVAAVVVDDGDVWFCASAVPEIPAMVAARATKEATTSLECIASKIRA